MSVDKRETAEEKARKAAMEVLEGTEDLDLLRMGTGQMIKEIIMLRDAIRRHQRAKGHDLCWFQPELWALLPENKGKSLKDWPDVPPTCEFLDRCRQYRRSLCRLSNELDASPVDFSK